VEAEKKKYAATRNFKQASASQATLKNIAKDIEEIKNKKEILANARDYIGKNIEEKQEELQEVCKQKECVETDVEKQH
jgi:hypothetical protein